MLMWEPRPWTLHGILGLEDGAEKAREGPTLATTPEPWIHTPKVQLQGQDILEEDALLLGQLPGLLLGALVPDGQLEHVIVHHPRLHRVARPVHLPPRVP